MSAPTAASGAARRITLSLPARDFTKDWRRYNLVANYVAEYASYFFEHRDRAENVISSVLYELLEHMTAISSEDAQLGLRLAAEDGRVSFQIGTRGADAGAIASHKALIAELGGGKAAGLYRRMLEAGAEAPGRPGELGLAMIAHDYRAHLATQVDPAGAVTLSASIGQEEMNP
jgi:hypothetical protein